MVSPGRRVVLVLGLAGTWVSLPLPSAAADDRSAAARCGPGTTWNPGRRWEERAVGFGVELATGSHEQREPVDHLAFGVAVSAEYLLSPAVLIGARLGYVGGGDAGEDRDRDGADDADTRNAHLLTATLGPRFRLWTGRERTLSFWDLELFAGENVALSTVAETGALVGGGLALGVGPAFRIGVRAEHGLTNEHRAVLATLGLGPAARPESGIGGSCRTADEAARGTPFALALHVPVLGRAMVERLGLLGPGFGVELGYQVGPPHFDLLARADALWFAGDDRDGVAYHTGLGGLRVVFPAVPLAAVGLVGYGTDYGTQPPVAGPGVVTDVSIRTDLARLHHGGMTLALGMALHARFGMSRDNDDLAAAYVAFAGEFRSPAYR